MPRIALTATADPRTRTDIIEALAMPDAEVLVARDGQDVAEHLAALTPARAKAIGEAALLRVLGEHTYALRAAQVDVLLRERVARAREAA